MTPGTFLDVHGQSSVDQRRHRFRYAGDSALGGPRLCGCSHFHRTHVTRSKVTWAISLMSSEFLLRPSRRGGIRSPASVIRWREAQDHPIGANIRSIKSAAWRFRWVWPGIPTGCACRRPRDAHCWWSGIAAGGCGTSVSRCRVRPLDTTARVPVIRVRVARRSWTASDGLACGAGVVAGGVVGGAAAGDPGFRCVACQGAQGCPGAGAAVAACRDAAVQEAVGGRADPQLHPARVPVA